jgi:chromosome segregation ATPase
MISHLDTEDQVSQVTSLQQQITLLQKQNEVLQHCLEKANGESESYQRRVIILTKQITSCNTQIKQLACQVEELRQHLNPQ